jgi:hypothetical protein
MVIPLCSKRGKRSGVFGGRGIKAIRRHSTGQNSLVKKRAKGKRGERALGTNALGLLLVALCKGLLKKEIEKVIKEAL